MAVKGKKLTVFDSRQNLSKLSADQRDCLFYLYSKACALKIDYSKKYDLLLTNPLYSDSYLPSEESQINFYMDMVKQYFTRPVLIKPHPRDHVNYRNYFPEAVVIDENISCEILMLSKNLQLSTVLTVFSSAAGQFEGKAEQVIKLSQSVSVQDMPFLNPYKNEGA